MARRSTIGEDPLDALLPRDSTADRRAERPPEGEGTREAETPPTPTPTGDRNGSAASSSPCATPGQYLTFRVGDELYAISILRVREILELGPVTRVPHCPPWIRGVMNLRGSVVPVIDLRLRVGLPVVEGLKHRCIVVVEVGGDGDAAVLGAVADGVREVVSFEAEAIRPVPAFGTRIGPEYLAGMAESGEQLVLLIDAARLLSRTELNLALGAADRDASASEPREGSQPPEADPRQGEPGPGSSTDGARGDGGAGEG